MLMREKRDDMLARIGAEKVSGTVSVFEGKKAPDGRVRYFTFPTGSTGSEEKTGKAGDVSFGMRDMAIVISPWSLRVGR
jgi:hypothetical protein